jgi:hypothetical protein
LGFRYIVGRSSSQKIRMTWPKWPPRVIGPALLPRLRSHSDHHRPLNCPNCAR